MAGQTFDGRPLDRPLTITTFPNPYAKTKKVVRKSLREIIAPIQNKSAPSKAALPWLKLATFGDETTDKGSLRHDANIIAVDGVEIDYDKGEISINRAAMLFWEADIAALIYSSPSHTASKPRWRALFPLSKTLPPRERNDLCGRANRVLDGAISPESFTLSQSYYYGRVGDNPDHTVVAVEGRYIDQATEIAPLAKVNGSKTQLSILSPSDDPLDDLAANQGPINLSDDELHDALMSIPNDNRFDERDDWKDIGMAVNHQTERSEFGRNLWYEWSIQHHSHSDEAFEKAWESFGKRDDKRPLITALYIVKLANEIKRQTLAAKVNDLITQMNVAPGVPELKSIIVECQKLKVDDVDYERLATALQKALRNHQTTMTIGKVRDLIKYRVIEVETPGWLENWVYLAHAKQFYDRITGQQIDREAFDAVFGRFVGADTSASRFALNTVKIPTFHMTTYLPTQDQTIIDSSGLDWINKYRSNQLPPIPSSLSARDIRNIEIVEKHAYHLFSDRDAEMLHSWLAHIVKTGGRSNWSIILQGAQGSGKTFYAPLMAAVVGGKNVYILGTDTLQNSQFTSWAEGWQLVFIEELKLHGHNRFDILNKLKPYITNSQVEIHPKNISPYNVPNTVNYLAATNHRDALPLDDDDSRYYIAVSRWPTKKSLVDFHANNPVYYRTLYNTFQESPGALRKWLLDYKMHSDFDPDARAPRSHGKEAIIRETKSDERLAIEDLIEDGQYPLISNDILVTHILREVLADDMGRIRYPILSSTQGLRRLLETAGFRFAHRIRVGEDRYSCWSKNPSIINGDVDVVKSVVLARMTTDIDI